jgi:hypothetical protein
MTDLTKIGGHLIDLQQKSTGRSLPAIGDSLFVLTVVRGVKID